MRRSVSKSSRQLVNSHWSRACHGKTEGQVEIAKALASESRSPAEMVTCRTPETPSVNTGSSSTPWRRLRREHAAVVERRGVKPGRYSSAGSTPSNHGAAKCSNRRKVGGPQVIVFARKLPLATSSCFATNTFNLVRLELPNASVDECVEVTACRLSTERGKTIGARTIYRHLTVQSTASR
jgi:hypothetical protein